MAIGSNGHLLCETCNEYRVEKARERMRKREK